jgi:hypothetical protein
MEIDKNWPVSWMEDVGVTCTECGESCDMDGHFTEVMRIESPADEEKFKKIYGLVSVKTEY